MVKKLLWIYFLAFSFTWEGGCQKCVFADTALVQLGPDGRPLVLQIPDTAKTTETSPPLAAASTPTAKALTDTGTLPPAWPQGYIYYTLPGGMNLVTPWSAAILAEGYDFVGRESITQGYLPLAQWWKVTAVFGGGLNGRGEGSPMGGGIVDLATVPVSNLVDFHLAVTGGYNFNARHALAVLSGSVQFLK